MTCFSGRNDWHVRVDLWHTTPQIWLVQIGHPPLELRPTPYSILVGIQPHHLPQGSMCLLGPKASPCYLCLKTWFWQSYSLWPWRWLGVGLGVARPCVWRLGSGRATLCDYVWWLWCWFKYSLVPTSEGLVLAEPLSVTLSDDLMLT